MKPKILFIFSLFFSFTLFAQTDNWYLLTKASEITKILPDDVNTDELHIGYIKYNTSTNAVTYYLNLTSQNPFIANLKDIALCPNSDDVAIYGMDKINIYNYQDSDLTFRENLNQFKTITL